MFNLESINKEEIESSIIESNHLEKDTLFKKYIVNEDDAIFIKNSEIALLIKDDKLEDIKEQSGYYRVNNPIIVDKEKKEEYKNISVRKAKNEMCVIFLNNNVIENNKYIIDDPIIYNDFSNGEEKSVYIKIEGRYDFKIEDPKKFISQVIGLRSIYTKQELIERIRIFVLKSIEIGINEISKEQRLSVNDIEKHSKDLEVKLKQNKYDEKLMEYGVKITYFDINNLSILDKKKKFF